MDPLFLGRNLRDARAGRYDVLIVWALDRLSRKGPLETLTVFHRFLAAGVQVVSLREPWTDAPGPMRDVLLAFSGYVL